MCNFIVNIRFNFVQSYNDIIIQFIVFKEYTSFPEFVFLLV